MRKGLFASALGIGAIVWLNTGAAAAFDPYPSGTVGYDVSYPQCGTTTPAGHFGIVGVNGGRPFDYNPCFGAEFTKANGTGNATVYINTGYDPAYTAVDGVHTTPDCATKLQSISGTPDQQKAWGAGCSEAQRDLGATGAATPAAWWLDVETANSWSTDVTLNQYTLRGIIETLRPLGTPIGIYSTAQQWLTITNDFPAAVDADWVATGQRTAKRARVACGKPGFTGAPVWLAQYVTATDNDFAC